MFGRKRTGYWEILASTRMKVVYFEESRDCFTGSPYAFFVFFLFKSLRLEQRGTGLSFFIFIIVDYEITRFTVCSLL